MCRSCKTWLFFRIWGIFWEGIIKRSNLRIQSILMDFLKIGNFLGMSIYETWSGFEFGILIF